ALQECRRVLHPQGWLLVRLPAYRWLWSPHDELEHTARRYTVGSLRQALEAAGFRLQRATYANSLAFPLAIARRLCQRLAGGPPRLDLTPVPLWANQPLLAALLAEAAWIGRQRALPFGLSVMALARPA
ncbi:MAG: hypothetical protein GX605_06200, partial [Chloroflexi bacterium]|nr:hypothetical protein [Chloroflexota bacterium]